MTLHTQLKSFVDTYGIGILDSPYLTGIMADEKMFSDPDNRPLKPIFAKMVVYGHLKQIIRLWKTGKPSAATYMASYPGVEVDNLRYSIDCLGFALGAIDEVSFGSIKGKEITQAVNLEDDTVEYISHGSSDNIGTLIPAVMAQSVHRHLNAIANEEGSVIEFVRSEMGEPNAEEIRKKISGEQIDGVALAMRQMIDGRAFILGDMTGIGKGRQLAMLLKWAQRQGKKPVFVTEKSILFNDLYRDLKDIGYGDMRPFILNSDSTARITDAVGHIIYNLPSSYEIEEFRNTGEIPLGYDYLLLTYSQLKKDSRKSWKPRAVLSAIKGNYLIMDESHNASGITSNVGLFFQQAVQEAAGVCFASATYAKYASSMPIYAFKTAMGSAKISSEDLLDIVSQGGTILQEVMAQGLVESGSMIRRQRDMSEVERVLETTKDESAIQSLRVSYDKIIALIDDIRSFYKDYISVYINSIDPVGILSTTHKTSAGENWLTDDCKIKPWSPQQRLSPTIRQLLFALKTELAIDKTLEEVKSGRKPIVQISRTMESNIAKLMNIGDSCDNPDFAQVLKDSVTNVFEYEVFGKTSKKVGKKYVETSYSTKCKYQLSDVIDYYNSPLWMKSGFLLTGIKGEDVQNCYDQLLYDISSVLTGLPLSPIDYFVQRLTEEGLKVGELTERKAMLVYDDVANGPNSSVVCQARKKSDKKQLASDFNNGKIDVLIGNRVMASGISLHNSEGFADTRSRTMITWEQQDSADVQTQFDGRADRTGQLNHCKYIVLASPIPVEQRYLMLNRRKQRSLNANVEANQGRDTICVDIFNKYGAKVIEEFSYENPEYAETISGAQISQGANSFRKKNGVIKGKNAEFVSYFMRDLGLLSCAEQEKILTEVMERYNQLIASLDENNENDLTVNILPLQAELIKRQVFVPGKKDADSPFASDAYLDKYEVNVLRKPLNASEIKERMSTLNSAADLIPKIMEAKDRKIQAVTDYYAELRAIALRQLALLKTSTSYTPSRIKAISERADNHERMNKEIQEVELNYSGLKDSMESFHVGCTYSIPSTIIPDGQIDDPSYVANIPVGIFMGFSVMGDKYTKSRIYAIFAVNDSRSVVKIPMSDTGSLQTIIHQSYFGICLTRNSSINLSNWDAILAKKNRESAYIITGNVLAGIAKCKQCAKHIKTGRLSRIVMAMTFGHMVKYTDIHGNMCTGYMLPRSFHPKTFFDNITV